MNKDVAKKWVKALRSGRYQQAQGFLKDDTGYCCLGVLCDLYSKETKKGRFAFDDKTGEIQFMGDDNESEVLPDEVKEWAGMQTSKGELSSKIDTLADRNDCGATFTEIASIIERKWEML